MALTHFFQNLITLLNTNGNAKSGAEITYENNGSNEFIFVDERLFEQAMINIIKKMELKHVRVKKHK